MEDLQRLKYLFKQRGGNLYDAGTLGSVSWRDYKWFRVFDFEKYSVVVYPYNWTYDQYNVLVYACKLPRSENLVNDAHAVRIGGYSESKNICGFPKLDLDASEIQGLRIGMDYSYLGQTCEQYVDVFSATSHNFSSRVLSIPELRDEYCRTFAATGNTVSFSRIEFNTESAVTQCVSQHAIYENGLLIYVSYVSPNDRGPMLPAMAINKPRTIILAEGVIDLSHDADTVNHP